jgi:hypothetical protein
MLSKSQYVRGLQCYKSLWLYKNRPDLIQNPDILEESLFKTGHTVGELACQLFPGGIEIEFNPTDFEGMIEQTAELIKQGVDVIYEATFKENGIFAMADILVKNGQKWDVYEVKSATSVKEYHRDDSTVQWHALSNVLKLNRIFIVHINNQYERLGQLDVNKLFKIEDVTDSVLERLKEVPKNIKEMEEMISRAEPGIDIGQHCSNPHECDFKKYCWQDIPTPSIFDLYRMNSSKKFELYREGVIHFDQVPSGLKLTKIQNVQVESYKSNDILINTPVINDFLKTVEYPIHFFDFETFQNAIPRFDGQQPYAQIPFQYSLHILHADGRLEHTEFLGDENSDPRKDLAERMIQDILPTGSLMAFNQSFEKDVISKLAQRFPENEQALMQIHSRFVDLLVPFRSLGYYHPDFNGSFSIKSVLPAMFPNEPELDYSQLAIKHGGMAMDTFANLHLLKDKASLEKIRKDLLAYCRLDTLAMVKIFQKLKLLCGE